MFVPIVFAAVLSLLTTSPEKPLCCFATERGWIVYALGSPHLHILRPYIQVGFTPRVVLTSGKLRPSNIKDAKISALAVGNRLIMEYDYDYMQGFPSREPTVTRYRGECSLKDLFNGKVVDQKGQPSTLCTRAVDKIGDPSKIRIFISNMIASDVFENSEREILSVKFYESVDKARILGWFKCGDAKDDELLIEVFKVACPFRGHFKVFHVNDRYFFVTERGVLYTSLIDKKGKPVEITPVFLGFDEPITAMVSNVDSKRVFVFTRSRYFDLGGTIPSFKNLHLLEDISYAKDKSIPDELSDRTHHLYSRLIEDKRIKPVKLDAK